MCHFIWIVYFNVRWLDVKFSNSRESFKIEYKMHKNVTTRFFIHYTVHTTSQAPSFFYSVYHCKIVILFHCRLAYKRPKTKRPNQDQTKLCFVNKWYTLSILYGQMMYSNLHPIRIAKVFFILIIDFDVVGKTRWKWITVVSVNCKKLAGKNLVYPKKWEVNATSTVVYLPKACVKETVIVEIV